MNFINVIIKKISMYTISTYFRILLNFFEKIVSVIKTKTNHVDKASNVKKKQIE